MRKTILALGTLALIILISSLTAPGNKAMPVGANRISDTLNLAKTYAEYCGGCHGEKMEAYIDRKWVHGNTRNDLFKAIKDGYPDEGMPAFRDAFTDEQIYQLTDYMLEGIKKLKEYDFQGTSRRENLFTSESATLKLDTVTSGLSSVWAMAFLPKGELLITEKNQGKVFRIDKNKIRHEVAGVPVVAGKGQGGMLDIILDPAFAKNKIIYLSYSKPGKENGQDVYTTAVLKAKLAGDQLADARDIFVARPYSRTTHHYGGKMVFGKDGYLYVSVGERGNENQNPQNLANDLGKIHRIKSDGTIPADNPFVKVDTASHSIYSYGHRNPQGLTLNPLTGEIWEHEHGPRGGDEINLVQKGKNYGWPVITYGINYNGKIISNLTQKNGMEQPVKYWIPSIAPCGMAFLTGNKYPGLKGAVLSGSLRFKYLNASFVNGDKVTKDEMLLKNIGRVRDVRVSPEGFIYVAVEQPGMVFKVLPVK